MMIENDTDPSPYYMVYDLKLDIQTFVTEWVNFDGYAYIRKEKFGTLRGFANREEILTPVLMFRKFLPDDLYENKIFIFLQGTYRFKQFQTSHEDNTGETKFELDETNEALLIKVNLWEDKFHLSKITDTESYDHIKLGLVNNFFNINSDPTLTIFLKRSDKELIAYPTRIGNVSDCGPECKLCFNPIG
jgi:hypothetical protein